MAPGDQRRTRRAPSLRVAVVDDRGRPIAAAALKRWLIRVAPATARGDVTIALAPDRRVRALNNKYRKKDYATDVLSFPADERGALGDVVIATGVAQRQARAAGHPVGVEINVLALHGLLHLLGYDHEADDGRMARVERRLRKKGGLPESLTERGQGAEAPNARHGTRRAEAAKRRSRIYRAEAAKRRRRIR